MGTFLYFFIPAHDGGHRLLVCASEEDFYAEEGDIVDSFLVYSRWQVMSQLAWLLSSDAFQTEEYELEEVDNWVMESLADFWDRHAATAHSQSGIFALHGNTQPNSRTDE